MNGLRHSLEGKSMANTNGRLKRKEYEKELRELQVELCALQDWVKAQGLRGDRSLRRTRCRRQGRHDQGDHRACQPARVPRGGAAGALRPREDADVHAALHRSTSPRRARS